MNRLATLLLAINLLGTAAQAEGWLTYDRSGGITGWSLKVAVDTEGRVAVVGTREDAKASARAPLGGVELAELQRLVEVALAAPARKPMPELRHLADGMQRLVVIQDGEEGRLLVLSDGHALAKGDRELIAALEALAGREPDEKPTAEPAQETIEASMPLDMLVVGKSDPVASRATALLLELPVGRAHEPEGRAGAIELLLLAVLGAQSELLLEGGPELVDPDTGRWSLSITANRTRLLVVLEDLPPAALRGTTARLRRLLQRAGPTLEQVESGDLDQSRRRLAAAVHDRIEDPRVRRAAAARLSAWGLRAGASPSAFSVSAIEREDLSELARRIRASHARFLAAGPLADHAVAFTSRGFERRARGPLAEASPAPGLDGPTAPTNERLLAAAVMEVSQGPAGAMALELAQRRHPSTWLERLEPGSSRLSVPGDTWLLVGPGGGERGAEENESLRRTLEVLSRGVSQSAIDTRLRRQALGTRNSSDATRLVREAADQLELGTSREGTEGFEPGAVVPNVEVEDLRAAAAALALAMEDVPSGPSLRERPAILDRAVSTLLGGLEATTLHLTGERDGAAWSCRVDLQRGLPLLVHANGESLEVNAGSIGAGNFLAAAREQALVLEALSDPALLVAGAARGLFPVRSSPGGTLEADGKTRRCEGLEVLVPARGLFRLLIDAETGDAWAVDRPTSGGETTRVLMSDIQDFEGGRRTATRRVLLSGGSTRQVLLERASLRLEAP